MIKTKNSSKALALSIVVALFAQNAIVMVDAQLCTLCPNGGAVLDPETAFTMVDVTTGDTADWTCGYLEEAFSQVNAVGGAPGESFNCELARIWACRECQCASPCVDDPDDVYDPFPSCDLCGPIDGQVRDLSFVPGIRAGELVNTGVAGRMPCGGLYDALSRNVLSPALCPGVKRNAGAFCCSYPTIEESDLEELNNPDPTPPPGAPPSAPPCRDTYEKCHDGPCCGSLICKVRVLGDDPICSPPSRRAGKNSLAGSGRGGAGGANKFAN